MFEKIKDWFKKNCEAIYNAIVGFMNGWCLAAGLGLMVALIYNLATGKEVVLNWRNRR